MLDIICRPSLAGLGLFLTVLMECVPVEAVRSLVFWAPMVWNHSLLRLSQLTQIWKTEPHQAAAYELNVRTLTALHYITIQSHCNGNTSTLCTSTRHNVYKLTVLFNNFAQQSGNCSTYSAMSTSSLFTALVLFFCVHVDYLVWNISAEWQHRLRLRL